MDRRTPAFGRPSTSSFPSSSSRSRNRPTTAPSYPSQSFLPLMPDSSSPALSSSGFSTSRSSSVLSSPADSFSSTFSSTHSPRMASTAFSREDVLPWESQARDESPPPTIVSTSTINSKLYPPPSKTTQAVLPSSPPSRLTIPSSSGNLQRTFSSRPTSIAYGLATNHHPSSSGNRSFSSPSGSVTSRGVARPSVRPPSIPSSLVENSAVKSRDPTLVSRHYLVGTTELVVLDHESLLGETMRLCVVPDEGEEGRNTFVKLGEGEKEPARVLDVGCGLGLWAVEQAQEWKSSKFVGLDIDPVQVDLEALAMVQQETGGVREGGVDWEEIRNRVEWVQADFLETLPFDSGSFDFVHVRYVNLGIPEAGWQSLFEELARVLKKATGILEIVETSYTLPPPFLPLSTSSTPTATSPTASLVSPFPSLRPGYQPPLNTSTSRFDPPSSSYSSSTHRHHTPSSSISLSNSAGLSRSSSTATTTPSPSLCSQRSKYEQHLETHLVQPVSSIVVRPAFLMTSGLGKMKLVAEKSWGRREENRAPGVLAEASEVWAESMFPSAPPAYSHASQTGTIITTELHQTYGLQGYAPRPSPSETKKGARLSKMLLASARNESGSGGSGGSGRSSPVDGGKVESWAWVGRKTA